MYYVCDDNGVVREFDNYSDCLAWYDSFAGEDMWISCDEDDLEPSYNEDEGFDPYMGDYSWDC